MTRARTVARWAWRVLATLAALLYISEGVQQALAWMGYVSPLVIPLHTTALLFFLAAGWMLKSGWSS